MATLISRRECLLTKEIQDKIKSGSPKALTSAKSNAREVKVYRITYRSRGFAIVGFVVKPRHTGKKKLPTLNQIDARAAWARGRVRALAGAIRI
jgi:cephalosporin-C deacetylase-like acetyl esterase